MKQALLFALAFVALTPRTVWSMDEGKWESVVDARSARDARKMELETLTAKQNALLPEAVKGTNEAVDKAAACRKALTDAKRTAAAQALSTLPKPLAEGSTSTAILDALSQLKGALTQAMKEAAKLEGQDNAAGAAGGSAPTASTTPIGQLDEILEKVTKRHQQLASNDDQLKELNKALTKAEQEFKTALERFQAENGPAKTLPARIWPSRKLRCMTAYCFGGIDHTKYGIEPVLDLPFAITWSAAGGALGSYVNSHALNVEFNAGLRYWFAYDTASIMVYISRPVIQSTDPIQIPGSTFQHNPSAIRRPYPSLGIGLFGDLLLFGVSLDELRNGTAEQTKDPKYPAGDVLSRSLTVSIGLSFFNAARNAVDVRATSTGGSQ